MPHLASLFTSAQEPPTDDDGQENDEHNTQLLRLGAILDAQQRALEQLSNISAAATVAATTPGCNRCHHK